MLTETGIMNEIRNIPDSIYQGEGISKGLARGLLVYYGDQNLTGEGMGIGSIATRDHECTYFSRSCTDSTESGVLKRTFTLVLSLPIDEAWFTIPLPLPGTPLFARVADLRKWEDWEVSNQVKFVYPSEFDERWLERRINETMETFRKKKDGISS
jgi:hypothetical protein